MTDREDLAVVVKKSTEFSRFIFDLLLVVVRSLAKHPDFDREAMIREIEALPVPDDLDTSAWREAYEERRREVIAALT